MYHKPVMLEECLNGLNIQPSGVYVDVTFGGGGHSKAILEKLDDNGRLIAFDQDADAASNIPDDQRFRLVDHNFSHLKRFLKAEQAIPVDGLIADLGVSSHQFDTGERGFSIRFDGPLDMRMDRHQELDAAEIVNTYKEEDLANVLYQYGELHQSRAIARLLVASRLNQPFKTTAQLKDVLAKIAPRKNSNQFYAQVFQALRIEVNGELDVLKKLLEQSIEVIRPGGRLVVMSYHSLEDRLVKNFMNKGNWEGKEDKDFYGNLNRPFQPITRRAVTASEAELAENTRSRSAKLRIAEKL